MNEPSIVLEAEPARGFVRLRVRGRLTMHDAGRAQAEAIKTHAGLARLWDFREADLTAWSAEDMRSFDETARSREDGTHRVRVAALVSRDVDYGLARMYELLSESGGPGERAVFRDEASAEQWISATKR